MVSGEWFPCVPRGALGNLYFVTPQSHGGCVVVGKFLFVVLFLLLVALGMEGRLDIVLGIAVRYRAGLNNVPCLRLFLNIG